MANDFKIDEGAKKRPFMYQNEYGDMVEGSILMGTREIFGTVCQEILITYADADGGKMYYTAASDAVLAFGLIKVNKANLDPKDVADFVLKNVRENGRMLMYFTDPTGEECEIWFLNEFGLLDLYSLTDMDMDNVDWRIGNSADDNNEIDMNKVGWIV